MLKKTRLAAMPLSGEEDWAIVTRQNQSAKQKWPPPPN